MILIVHQFVLDFGNVPSCVYVNSGMLLSQKDFMKMYSTIQILFLKQDILMHAAVLSCM